MQVREFLHDQEVPFEVFTHRPTFGASRMAQIVHVAGARVAKTVLLRAYSADDGVGYVVAVLPATHQVMLDWAADALRASHCELASEREIAEQCPDCELGVLPPFGSQYGMRTLVDEALTEETAIVFEGNTHQETICLQFDDFLQLERPRLAHFAVRA